MEPGRDEHATPPATHRIRPTPGSMPRSLKDVLAGLVFVVFGLGFAVVAVTYDIGSANRMGPGSSRSCSG